MQVQFTLETITPLFLGGAEQQAELRTASVRGALRYWLRAGFSGVLGEPKIAQVAQFERKIFGSTDAASPVVVRFFAVDQVNPANRQLLPHRNQGMAQAWPEGKRCQLILSLAPHGKLQNNASDLIENATWAALLWLVLGGLGRRSRRGAGSFKIINAQWTPNTLTEKLKESIGALSAPASDAAALAQDIGYLVEDALASFDDFIYASEDPTFASYVSHPILRDATRITVWTPDNTDLNDPNTALRVLMNKMSATNRSLGGSFYNAFGGVGNNRRFASPLHVSLHPLTNQWAFVMTYLGSETWKEGAARHTEVRDFFANLGNTTEAFGGSNG